MIIKLASLGNEDLSFVVTKIIFKVYLRDYGCHYLHIDVTTALRNYSNFGLKSVKFMVLITVRSFKALFFILVKFIKIYRNIL